MCCCLLPQSATTRHHGMQGHDCCREGTPSQGELGRLRQVLQSLKSEIDAIESRIATLETEP